MLEQQGSDPTKPAAAATGFPATTEASSYAPVAPPQSKPTVDWSTGLCDCFSDCGNCCITWWCPCVTFGRVAEIVDRGSTSCGASGALYTLVCCGWPYSCIYRSKMRRQYGLKGNCCTDCLLHCCCESCALCQEYRELKQRGFDMIIGWHGNVEQRIQEVAMTAATPPSVEKGMSR
uniref:Uncharacterized protein n=1 Tax=Glycine max TaxID=3847 RepID=C6T452_SOYBN|nr:unknown [Glycine max]